MTKATPTVEALRQIERLPMFSPATVKVREIARTALPIAEREAEVKAMLVTALQNATGLLDTPAARRRFGGSDFHKETVASINDALEANKALKATTGGAE